MMMKRAICKFMAIAGSLLIAGCSTTEIVNSLVPGSGYHVVKNQAYATGPRHDLDIYVPDDKRQDHPVIVFFYGGNWQTGSKDMYLFLGEALATRGFIVVIPDYRLYPQTRFPGFLEDAALAVRWTRDHIDSFGGDPNRIALMGHSAGGYIAAMLAIDPQWLAAVGMDHTHDIRAFVGLAGPYDFLPLTDPVLKIIFGPEQERPATQPINFVDGKAPPMFLAAGTDDDTVDPGNSTRLANRVHEKGGEAIVKFYPDIGHAELVGAMANSLRFLAPVRNDVVDFLNTTMPAQTASAKGGS